MRAESGYGVSHSSLKLYVIIDESLIHGRDGRWILERVIEGGADVVQFRAKRLSKRQYYEQALALLSVSRRHHTPFFVNDHLDIALAIKADGIHLGQNDLPFSAAKGLIPESMLLGVSTHSPAQAAEAMREPVSYIAIGPVFPTTTKEKPDPVVGVHTVSEVRNLIGNIPLVAIGGITAANVTDTILAGADGVALASAVVAAECPREAARLLKQRIVGANRANLS